MNIPATIAVVISVWLTFTAIGIAKIKIQNWRR